MHNIYSYHAKFNPEIPRKFIQDYSKENDLVLDPFCGCGTTLLEGLKLKRNVIGVDVSPIGIICSKVKTQEYKMETIKTYAKDILNVNKNKILIPKFPDRDIWYSQENLRKLGELNYNISKIKDKKYYRLFYLILLSCLNNCSRKRKTWNLGYIADNVLPNMDRDVDPIKVYKRKLSLLYKRTDWLNNICNTAECIESDIIDVNFDEVDLVVTSPPYPFAVDFIKYHRLTLYWMEKKVDNLSDKEVGARNKRNKKQAIDDFFKEMEKIYLHVMSMIKKDGYWCMTIGDTTRQKEKINFVDWTIELFKNNGWKIEENSFRNLKNQTMAQKRIKQEAVLVFKKMI